MFWLEIFRSQQDILSGVAEMSPLAEPLDETLLDTTIPPPTEFQDFNTERALPKTPEPYQDANDLVEILDLQEDIGSQFRPSMSSLTPDLIFPAGQNVLKTAVTSTPRNTQNSMVRIVFFFTNSSWLVMRIQVITPSKFNVSPVSSLPKRQLHPIELIQASKYSPLVIVPPKHVASIELTPKATKQQTIMHYIRPSTSRLSGISDIDNLSTPMSTQSLVTEEKVKPCIACTRLSSEQVCINWNLPDP